MSGDSTFECFHVSIVTFRIAPSNKNGQVFANYFFFRGIACKKQDCVSNMVQLQDPQVNRKENPWITKQSNSGVIHLSDDAIQIGNDDCVKAVIYVTTS